MSGLPLAFNSFFTTVAPVPQNLIVLLPNTGRINELGVKYALDGSRMVGASPGITCITSLSEMHSLTLDLESEWGGPALYIVTGPPGASDACSSLRATSGAVLLY